MKRWLIGIAVLGLIVALTRDLTRILHSGDEEAAKKYDYQGMLLLNDVRNQLRLSANVLGPEYGLKQLRLERRFPDGTIIEALSVFSQEQVRIFTPPVTTSSEETSRKKGWLFYGTRDGKVWRVDPDSLTVKGPFQADSINLFSVVSGKNQVIFATGGLETSYITAFGLQGKKVKSANLNFLASGYNENGFNSMLIDAKQKYIYGTTDTFYDANWNGGYPGIVRLDAKTLQPIDVISMEGTVTGNFMFSAARLGNIGYFCSAAGIVMMQLDPFAYLGTFVWNTSGYYFNPPLIPGSPPPPLVYGDESPGLVVADKARNCLYVGMSNTVTKRLLKLSPSLGVLANLPLADTPESSAMSSGVIIGKYLFYGATPNGPPDKLVKVNLETFAVVSELQLSGWTAAITTDGKNVFVGVNENTFRAVNNRKYNLVKVHPSSMTIVKSITLASGTDASIESGVFVEE